MLSPSLPLVGLLAGLTPFAASALLSCSVLGCSGTSSNSSDGGVDSGDGGTPVVLPDGDAVPTLACGDENVSTAAGTWDAVASGGSAGQGSAVITVDASSFTVTSSGKTLAFRTTGTTMTLQWTDTGAGRQSPIAVTHSGTPVETGLLPLAVGGQWTFRGQGNESCSSSLTDTAFTTTCAQVRSTPFGNLEGTVIGIREQKAASLFGELGGKWHLTGAGSASVDATISGNVFTAVVNGDGGALGKSGWVTVKMCNGAAAGKTSSGLELAATRR